MELDEVEKSLVTIVELANQLAQQPLTIHQQKFVSGIHRGTELFKSVLDHLRPLFENEETQWANREMIRHDLKSPVVQILFSVEILSNGTLGSRDLGVLTEEQTDQALKIKQLASELRAWLEVQ